MRVKNIFGQFKPDRFINAVKFIGYCSLLLFLTTCKKEIAKEEISNSAIKYFDGGVSDKVNTINKTSDGGFIYCGYTGKNENHTDAFLMKVDANGNQLWYKTYGGKDRDEFNHVIQTSDGGFLAVGTSNSYGFGATSKAITSYDYTVKTDANGNELWNKSILNYASSFQYAVENAAHEYIITGFVTLSSDADILTFKLSENGNIIWGYSYKGYLQPPNLAAKNTYHDVARFASIAHDGDIMVGGVMSKSGLVIEVSKMVTFTMKINIATGKVNWLYPYNDYARETAYKYGFASHHNRRPIVQMINLPDGYMVGTYLELTGNVLKMQLLKIGLDGAIIWQKQYGGLGNAIMHNLEANADGSYLLIGMSTKEPINNSFPEMFANLKTMLLKVDKDGNELWTSYTGSETNANISKCVQPLSNDGWLLAGFTTSTETGFDKMFYMTVDKEGKLVVK